jgi:hypothetical protein
MKVYYNANSSVVSVPIPQTNTLGECLKACDDTPGCVDVSYVAGTPGPCYMKGSIGDVRINSNIWGGRKLSECTSSSKFKLHRKRVMHNQGSAAPIQKRGIPYGPDFIYYPPPPVTETQTSTTVITTGTT